MGKYVKTLSKIVAVILIFMLLWSDFAFLLQNCIVFAENNIVMGNTIPDETVEEEQAKINIDLMQAVDKQINIVDIDDTTYTTSSETMIQTVVKLGIKGEDAKDAVVTRTELEIKVPNYDNCSLSKVEVKSRKTAMTNGDNYAQEFGTANWTYDADNSVVKITVDNANKQIGNGIDEYYISYYYSDTEQATARTITQNVKAKLAVEKNEKQINLETEQELDLDLAQAKSDVLATNVSSDTQKINKSKIYANLLKQTNEYDLEYETKTLLNINYNQRLANIKLQDEAEEFVGENETIYKLEHKETAYKETRVKQFLFNKILGEDGYIKIFDKANQLIATIDKNSTPTEDGYLVASYGDLSENTIQNVKMELSKPISDGFLEIENKKTIYNILDFNKEELVKYNKMNITINDEYEDDGSIYGGNSVLSLDLEESTSSAILDVNNTKLAVNTENEDVEWKIYLNNSRETTDLWKNPTLFIELPEEIESIEINDIKLLYQDELGVAEIVQEKVGGKIILKIEMRGCQQRFISETIENGTSIILKANINIKELTPAQSNKQVALYYMNENVATYDNPFELTIDNTTYNTGKYVTNIDYVAPVEMKLIQKLSNFNNEGSIVSSNSSQNMGKLEVFTSKKIANSEITVINNTGNLAENMSILGRIPFKGNKAIETNTDLGTTIDAYMSSRITTDINCEIYYSANGEATKDLSLESNGWTTDYDSIEKIKSFLVVVSRVEIGEKIKLNYELEIPEKLEQSEFFYGDMVCYYTNNAEEGASEQKVILNKIGLTTGIGAKLAISQDLVGDSKTIVNEGEILKYAINVKNTGSVVAEGVKIKNKIPEGTIYKVEVENKNEVSTVSKCEYYKDDSELIWDIGDLEEGQSITVEFEVEVNKLPTIMEYYGMKDGFTVEDGKYYLVTRDEETGTETKEEIKDIPMIYVTNVARVSADNIEKEISSNITRHEVGASYISVQESSSIPKSVTISEKQEFEYDLILENTREINLGQIEIRKTIPEGLKYKSAELVNKEAEIVYNETNGELNIKTEAGQSKTLELKIKVEAEKLPDGIYEKDVTTHTEVYINDRKIGSSSALTNHIGKPNLEGQISCDIKDNYIYEGEILNYTVSVKNSEKTTANDAKILIQLPEELEFITGSYTQGGIEYTVNESDGKKVEIKTNIEQNQNVEISIKVKANKLTTSEESKEIITVATINANNYEEKELGKIRHKLQKSNSAGGDDNGDIDEDGKISYRIRGTAWLDENKDGERQDNEKLLEGIQVYLIDEKGNVVLDKKTGEEKSTKTDSTGEYSFRNLAEGNYFVVFVYNNDEYELTEYQKKGVAVERNSDVSNTKINFKGQSIEGAVTGLLEVRNRNIINIDMGLKTRPKFDLELNNAITKIVVQTANNTDVHEYDNAKLAKVEIHSKEVKNATVLIEYNIAVKNVGDVEGTANKIASRIAEGLSFNSELNTDWYLGNDGKIYTTSLASKNIKAGETANIKLTLSKKMTGNNTGTYANTASIVETYNDKEVADRNVRNNESKAECLITISTGRLIIYTSLGIAILLALAIGIYIIRKVTKVEVRIYK